MTAVRWTRLPQPSNVPTYGNIADERTIYVKLDLGLWVSYEDAERGSGEPKVTTKEMEGLKPSHEEVTVVPKSPRLPLPSPPPEISYCTASDVTWGLERLGMKLLSHFFPLKRQSQCCQVDASQNYGVIVEVKAIKVVEGQGRRHMSSIHGLRVSPCSFVWL